MYWPIQICYHHRCMPAHQVERYPSSSACIKFLQTRKSTEQHKIENDASKVQSMASEVPGNKNSNRNIIYSESIPEVSYYLRKYLSFIPSSSLKFLSSTEVSHYLFRVHLWSFLFYVEVTWKSTIFYSELFSRRSSHVISKPFILTL